MVSTGPSLLIVSVPQSMEMHYMDGFTIDPPRSNYESNLLNLVSCGSVSTVP